MTNRVERFKKRQDILSKFKRTNHINVDEQYKEILLSEPVDNERINSTFLQTSLLDLSSVLGEELFSEKEIKLNLRLGDHLVTPRTGYDHHGIYIGNGKVIHYAGFSEFLKKDKVTKTTLEEFANGQEVHFVYHPNAKYNGKERVKKANSLLDEDNYNLVTNNCEHFAHWCIYGEKDSEQVDDIIFRFLVTGITLIANLHPVIRIASFVIFMGSFLQDEEQVNIQKEEKIRRHNEIIKYLNDRIKQDMEEANEISEKRGWN